MLKTFGFVFLFLFGLILVTVIDYNRESEEVKGEKIEENLIIGYCKTFERYAQALAQENDLDIVRLSSSGEVLSQVNSGNIDYGVIGRRAYSFEIGNHIVEKPIKELGWTLVGKEKDFVVKEELKNFEIHTYLDEQEVMNFFSLDLNITYHDDIDSAFNSEGIALIAWKDFRDEFELIVPHVKDSDAKVEKFRTPMLYMNEDVPELETEKIVEGEIVED